MTGCNLSHPALQNACSLQITDSQISCIHWEDVVGSPSNRCIQEAHEGLVDDASIQFFLRREVVLEGHALQDALSQEAQGACFARLLQGFGAPICRIIWIMGIIVLKSNTAQKGMAGTHVKLPGNCSLHSWGRHKVQHPPWQALELCCARRVPHTRRSMPWNGSSGTASLLNTRLKSLLVARVPAANILTWVSAPRHH